MGTAFGDMEREWLGHGLWMPRVRLLQVVCSNIMEDGEESSLIPREQNCRSRSIRRDALEHGRFPTIMNQENRYPCMRCYAF
jgi:hypothetical protein